MGEVPRNTLGGHTEALIADVLDAREQSVIKATLVKLGSGTLDPTYAVQQWIVIAEGRKLRSSLLKRSQVEAARIQELM